MLAFHLPTTVDKEPNFWGAVHLLREYFPKGSDLTEVEQAVIQEWEDKLNNRPRKCLNWKMPYEVFYRRTVPFNLTIQQQNMVLKTVAF